MKNSSSNLEKAVSLLLIVSPPYYPWVTATFMGMSFCLSVHFVYENLKLGSMSMLSCICFKIFITSDKPENPLYYRDPSNIKYSESALRPKKINAVFPLTRSYHIFGKLDFFFCKIKSLYRNKKKMSTLPRKYYSLYVKKKKNYRSIRTTFFLTR